MLHLLFKKEEEEEEGKVQKKHTKKPPHGIIRYSPIILSQNKG
jgi:hypothetical protein